MRGRKYVVWILVVAIVGTVSLAQGQTQVVRLIAASEQYGNEVLNKPDIHGLFRDDYATWSAITRAAATVDWIPRFKEQAGTPAPGSVPGPSGLGETTVEPVRQAVPIWRVVPTLSVSERYDTNVFFAPKQDIAALNVQPEDFVTTVTPQLAVLHTGKLVQGRLQGGITSEFYVLNPDLNYTGYNGQLYVDLAQAVRQVLPRTRSLIVSDSLLYTPQLPAFAQGGPNFYGLGSLSQTADTFGRGIQAFRINTFTNTGSAQGFYRLTPTTDFGVGYTYATVRFSGTPLGAGSQNQAFNTTVESINGGPRFQLSPRDLLNLTYSYTATEQTGFGTFKTHTAQAMWQRAVSPSLGSTISGGAIVFEEFRSPATGTTLVQAGSVFPTASVSLAYREVAGTGRSFGGQSIQGGQSLQAPGLGSSPLPSNIPSPGGAFLPPGGTLFSLGYSVGVAPSFLLSAGPMLSQIVWLQGARGLTDTLGITGGLNYGRMDAASETQNFSFVSFATNLALNYLFTPTLRASLIYTFGNYQQSGLGATGGEFNRQTAMFNFTYVLGDSFMGLTTLLGDTGPGTSGVDGK